MPLTKLIFGLHTTSTKVTLTVGGQPADPATVLTVIKSGSSTPASVPWDDKETAWMIDLEAGDYLVKMEVPSEEEWFNGALPVTVSDPPEATFVFHGPETESPNTHETLAWTSSATAAGSDPKDPWPPPAAVAATLPTASFDWHDSMLHAERVNIETPRGL